VVQRSTTERDKRKPKWHVPGLSGHGLVIDTLLPRPRRTRRSERLRYVDSRRSPLDAASAWLVPCDSQPRGFRRSNAAYAPPTVLQHHDLLVVEGIASQSEAQEVCRSGYGDVVLPEAGHVLYAL
jgi:hypothetical protein